MKLIQQCIEAYWGEQHSDEPLDSDNRMRSVLAVVAQEIESMAPSKTVAKICHLQCLEIADRLRRICND